ncbi:UDP-N-acetylmuramoyl-L-alanyl-D-glutamate--2,6-diaminopimelate ligase [Photobacterium profundum]|uniref:UDP-N-acetylmuramoylananine-D-glutamate-2,6-diaminopimelate ligase n=1 Tax=Photobacterium profundum 3TCK TaxID=314280 RepID=Q1Z5Z4_9GAMM|nr:UDP-N-acetylmuramoyl-L-alanyl-D-glutamate--2,6-diaminopimelate ligase [Photobacterium profundum]EAS44050.1 UDP-N-acetylmuramoylananine-D-glutamate-2,6- diaminopimelate ligase [Photobacterium profundum 3TCK]PSV61761.1 UDP-N-acetylmuramoyl-L-alanyl-D-glutamate--2,6-diaminopimelate ligase [Photobacterium profundum]
MSIQALKRSAAVLEQLPIRQFVINSEWVQPNDVFICREGASHDSHSYVDQAIKNGAIAVIANRTLHLDIPVIVTESHYQSLAVVKAVYDHPHQKMNHIGVTGTNGKTTVAHCLNQMLNQSSTSAYIGTLGVQYADVIMALSNTTPDGVTLLNIFRDMVECGVKHNVMELSSHALAQDRAGFLDLEVGIITNIGRDHLDYHRTKDAYVQAKLQIIDRIKPGGYAVINMDDPHAPAMFARCHGRVKTVSFSIHYKDTHNQDADFVAKEIVSNQFGCSFSLCYRGKQRLVCSQMPFLFNVENMLAMACALHAQGWTLDQIASGLTTIIPPDGRAQFQTLNNGATGLVDYAHNLDGLARLFSDIPNQTFRHTLTVVGVTGDRIQDAAAIGELCARYSDLVVFTMDNPLGIDQADIFRALTSRIESVSTPVFTIADRSEAISLAKQMSQKGDLIVVCGKGSETSQLISVNKQGLQDYIGDMPVLMQSMEIQE